MRDTVEKRTKAISFINNSDIVISTQIINEICINLLKKASYSEDEISIVIKKIFSFYQVELIDFETCSYSSYIRKKYHCSFWDSFILSSAIKAHCAILYSEDVNPKVVIEGLKIVNPFLL